MKNKRYGFTLAEMIITVVLLGILAAISVPIYSRGIERARGREARSQLMLLQAAVNVRQMEQRLAFNGANASLTYDCNNAATTCSTLYNLHLPTQAWDYSVAVAGNDFIAAADRQNPGGGGGWLTCRYTINSTQLDPGNNDPGNGSVCP